MLLPPKTATHSVQHCLYTAGVVFAQAAQKPEHPTYHLTVSEIVRVFGLSMNDLSQYRIFQVTRNPFDRLISGWVHQRELFEKDLSLQELVTRLEACKGLLPDRMDDFYVSFYGSIDHKRESFRRGHWGGLRFWMDQVLWNDVGVPVRYFKLEDLTKDTGSLADFLGLKLPSLPRIRVNSRGRNADYMGYYNDALRERTYQLYLNDFRNLGYGPP